MNHPSIQDALIILIVLIALAMSGPDNPPEPTIPQVIEQAKQASLADASKNELALYRQGKFMTTFGDNR